MLTDWSEYTLLSFGDSFTFGDGLYHLPEFNPETSVFRRVYTEYSAKTKQKNYTSVLAKNMGFKNYINFGIPGGSNRNSIRMLYEFLNQNPDIDTSKIFILFGLTDPFRDTIAYTNENDAHIYKAMTAHTLATTLHKISIHSNSIETSVAVSDVMFHEKRMLYEHIDVLTKFKYLVEKLNIQYFMYDIVNHTFNDPAYFDSKNGDYTDGLFDIYYLSEEDTAKNAGYNFSQNIFLNSKQLCAGNSLKYYKNFQLDKSRYYFDNKTMKVNNVPNLNKYFNDWAEANYTNTKSKDAYHEHFISTIDNAHWNEDGHKIVALMLQSWISERDSNATPIKFEPPIIKEDKIEQPIKKKSFFKRIWNLKWT